MACSGLRSSDTLKEAYLKSFKEMASKGFYSYDRVLGEDSKYILVCFPSEEVDLSNHHIVLLDATDEIEFSDNSAKSAFSHGMRRSRMTCGTSAR